MEEIFNYYSNVKKEWKKRKNENRKEIERLAEELTDTNLKLKEVVERTKNLEDVSKQIKKLEKERERHETSLRSIRRDINTKIG